MIGLYHFILLSARYLQCHFCPSSPAFHVVTIFYFSHSDRYVDYLGVVLICISLKANDAEHLFHVLICHLYILFNRMSLHVFCPLSNWIVVLLLSFESSSYILGTYSLTRTLLSNDARGFLSFENHYHKYRFPQWCPEAKRINDQCREAGLISRTFICVDSQSELEKSNNPVNEVVCLPQFFP